MDTRRDATALTLVGGGFLALAGFFLWRDLPDGRPLLALAAVALPGAAAALGRPRSLPALAPSLLLAGTVGAAVWYLAERTPVVLPALAVALVASVVAVLRADPDTDFPPASPLVERLRWYGFGAAALAATWAFYFQYLTLGAAADSVARRLLPTLAWLALGLALFVAGRRRARVAPSAEVGAALALVAVVKAACYDSTHLQGPLRVIVLAAAGALLLAGARMLRRPQPATEAA
jgi:hypothetical protein